MMSRLVTSGTARWLRTGRAASIVTATTSTRLAPDMARSRRRFRRASTW